MDNRSWDANAQPAPPTPPASPSVGYPNNGNPVTPTPPTYPGAYWHHQIGEELRAILSAGGIVPSAATLNQLLLALRAAGVFETQAVGDNTTRAATTAFVLANARTKSYFLARDEKATGVGGGSSVVGVQTRTLNTVLFNNIAGVALASNQITLPAGTYRVHASAPSFGVNQARAQLYNVTDSLILALGTSENGSGNANSDPSQNKSIVTGRITLTATKQIELRLYAEQVYANIGLGAFVADGQIEIYSTIEIEKE